MTRERTVLRGRRSYILREEGGNRANIVGSRFHLEDVKTRCSHLTNEDKASRFDIRSKREIEVDIRRAL